MKEHGNSIYFYIHPYEIEAIKRGARWISTLDEGVLYDDNN
jgi:hypothetical protein